MTEGFKPHSCIIVSRNEKFKDDVVNTNDNYFINGEVKAVPTQIQNAKNGSM